AFMRNGVKPIVRLRFANGAELRCTPTHRIWTLNRGYVRAEDLTERDRVMLNDVATPATDASWELPVKVAAKASSYHRGGSVIERDLPDRWSEGLAELTGHLVGDGWMTDVQTGWVYGLDDVADGLSQAHEGLLEELGGGVSRRIMKKATAQLRVRSDACRQFFRGLGVSTHRARAQRSEPSVPTSAATPNRSAPRRPARRRRSPRCSKKPAATRPTSARRWSRVSRTGRRRSSTSLRRSTTPTSSPASCWPT